MILYNNWFLELEPYACLICHYATNNSFSVQITAICVTWPYNPMLYLTKVNSSYGPLAYFSDIFISGKICKRTIVT